MNITLPDTLTPPSHYCNILRRSFGNHIIGYYKSLEAHILYASVMGYKLLR